jgi:hypothetical protein
MQMVRSESLVLLKFCIKDLNIIFQTKPEKVLMYRG